MVGRALRERQRGADRNCEGVGKAWPQGRIREIKPVVYKSLLPVDIRLRGPGAMVAHVLRYLSPLWTNSNKLLLSS